MNINLGGQMTYDLKTVGEDEPIESALMLMKSRHFRHLPVVDSTKKIVGLVSDRDLYRGLSCDEVSVSQVMIKEFKTVDLKTDIKEIVSLMVSMKVSAFLVTRDKKIIGIITSDDLLHLLLQLLEENGSRPTILEQLVSSFQSVADVIKSPNYV